MKNSKALAGRMLVVTAVVVTAASSCVKNTKKSAALKDSASGGFMSDSDILSQFDSDGALVKSPGSVNYSELARQYGLVSPEEMGLDDSKKVTYDLESGRIKGGVGAEASGDSKTDLRDHDSDIRDQGRRGTCSVHAVVAAMENKLRQKSNQKEDLSEEHLWNLQGQRPIWEPRYAASSYVKDESSWPYNDRDRGGQGVARISGMNAVSLASVSQVVAAVGLGNPVAIAVVTSPSFFSNVRGVITGSGGQAGGQHAAHAIRIVGVQQHSGNAATGGGYFIIRNSWGTTWGDRGYGYLPFNYCQYQSCYAAYEVSQVDRAGSGNNGGNNGGGSGNASGGGGQTPSARYCANPSEAVAPLGLKVRSAASGQAGVQVVCVAQNSPADRLSVSVNGQQQKLQLDPGDRITAIDNKPVSSEQQFADYVSAGSGTMSVTVTDGSQSYVATAVLSGGGQQNQQNVTPSQGGLAGVSLQHDPARYKRGAFVTQSSRSDLINGDFVYTIDGQAVQGADNVKFINDYVASKPAGSRMNFVTVRGAQIVGDNVTGSVMQVPVTK